MGNLGYVLTIGIHDVDLQNSGSDQTVLHQIIIIRMFFLRLGPAGAEYYFLTIPGKKWSTVITFFKCEPGLVGTIKIHSIDLRITVSQGSKNNLIS